MCSKSCWKYNQPGQQKVPGQQFMTIPVGPQIQAQYCNLDSACDMQYLWQKTQAIIDDVR
ncbi:hypothetical protein BS17DRAFT_698566 [Gyrodon lividus]|nr:hypothetical protein BS17DRAFT_698566 [Gyrodon lividus]